MKLDLFSTYLSGSWQWYRFSVGGLILLLLNAVSFSVEFDRFLTEIIVNLAPIPGDAAVFPLVPSLLLLIFVIVMEG
jgi:hypothetical protein